MNIEIMQCVLQCILDNDNSIEERWSQVNLAQVEYIQTMVSINWTAVCINYENRFEKKNR